MIGWQHCPLYILFYHGCLNSWFIICLDDNIIIRMTHVHYIYFVNYAKYVPAGKVHKNHVVCIYENTTFPNILLSLCFRKKPLYLEQKHILYRGSRGEKVVLKTLYNKNQQGSKVVSIDRPYLKLSMPRIYKKSVRPLFCESQKTCQLQAGPSTCPFPRWLQKTDSDFWIFSFLRDCGRRRNKRYDSTSLLSVT